jgi:hypothetical protein
MASAKDTTKYGKYIITDAKLPANAKKAGTPGERGGECVILITDDVIKGAFYLNCALIWKASEEGRPGNKHFHDFDEYVGISGE